MVPGYIAMFFSKGKHVYTLSSLVFEWHSKIWPFRLLTEDHHLNIGKLCHLDPHCIPICRNNKCKSLLSDGTKSNETMWKCTEEIVQVKEQVVFLPSNSLKVICIDGKQKRLVLRLLYMDHI